VRILVTGAASKIAQLVVRSLINEGHELTGIDRRPWSDAPQGIEMIQEATKKLANVCVEGFSGLLLDFVKAKKSNVIIRGLRAVSDFDFEFQRALMNRRLDENIDTVFIMTKGEYS